MKKVEATARERRRKQNIRRSILGALAAGGIISLVVLAPTAAGTLLKAGRRIFPSEFERSITRLRRRGLVVLEKTERGTFARITPAGRFALARFGGERIEQKPKRWDGDWRVVLYDISEHRKKDRIHLRELLHAFGFVRLQDSVWVYPYDCEDFITLVKADFRIGREVLYLVARAIENDGPLREKFDLPADRDQYR